MSEQSTRELEMLREFIAGKKRKIQQFPGPELSQAEIKSAVRAYDNVDREIARLLSGDEND